MQFTDKQAVQIFVDGFGELDSVYDAATDEFVCEDGMRVDRELLESGKGMNAILNDE